MGCRRDREGSKATLASTNSSRKAEAGSQFAIVGGSTTPISVSDRFRILAGAQSASCLVGISRHESFYSRSRECVTRAITRKKGTYLCLSFELTSSKASHPITTESSRWLPARRLRAQIAKRKNTAESKNQRLHHNSGRLNTRPLTAQAAD